MSTVDEAVPDAAAPLPRTYLVWLAGSRVSLLGDAALYFALGWAAAAHGGEAAALVLTAIALPRSVLLLVGGAVGDRVGVRRVVIAGDAVMLAATLAVAFADRGGRTPAWFLVVVAALVGTVDAFYLPATGAMPRRLMARAQLPRALAVQQAGRQVAALLGAPLGAVLVAAAGLSGAALVDAATFTVVLGVLVRVRPAFDAAPAAREAGLLAAAVDGVRIAAADRVLRAALLLTSVAAGSLLPVVSLVGPLLVRGHGWGASAAGLVAGGQGAGILALSALVARRGPVRRLEAGASGGLCVAAVGIAGLASAADPAEAVIAGVVIGLGSGTFATHIGPLVLASAPDTHLARFQALLTLVQSVALVVADNLVGGLAQAAGARTAAAACALAVGAGGLAGLRSGALRGRGSRRRVP